MSVAAPRSGVEVGEVLRQSSWRVQHHSWSKVGGFSWIVSVTHEIQRSIFNLRVR